MLEVALALGLFGVLAAAATISFTVAWTQLFVGGLVVTAIGLLVGVPTGILYHVTLARALANKGGLPRLFWLRPTALHGRLGADERRPILRWFSLGALGFGLTIVGCLLLAAGVMRGR